MIGEKPRTGLREEPRPAQTLAADLSTEEMVDELRQRGLFVIRRGEDRALPGLMLFAGGQVARWRGRDVRLSPREAEVLGVLAAAWPAPVPPDQLRRAVWGAYAGYVHNSDRVYVTYLRRKLEGLISTVSAGGGYRLDLPLDDEKERAS